MTGAVGPEASTSRPPVTVARAQTPRGDLALRRRGSASEADEPVWELIASGVFAMDSVDTSTEVRLAELALSRCERPARLLVGGLGLGHTALAVLADARVGEVEVAEIEADLVTWAHAGLVPSLAQVVADPRVTLVPADIAAVLTAPTARYDVVLLDVDNGPSFLVHPGNASLYGPDLLTVALGRLTLGGVLAIWAAQPEPALFAALTELATAQPQVGSAVEEHLLEVQREGRRFTYAVYTSRRGPAPTAAS